MTAGYDAVVLSPARPTRALALVFLATACSLTTHLEGLRGVASDGGSGADAETALFSLTATPDTIEVGPSVPSATVVLTVTRSPGFVGRIDIDPTALVNLKLKSQAVTIAADQTGVSLSVVYDATAKPGVYDVELYGYAGTAFRRVPLEVRIP
jgi:hypothetical protein